MLDIELLPAMRYVPTQKVRAPFVLFPPKPIAIRDPELGHDLRNGDDDSPRKWNRVPGERGIPQNGGSEKGEPKKGMHSLDIVGCSKIVSFFKFLPKFLAVLKELNFRPDYLRTKISHISALSNGYN
jgi:hypothetical protein